MKKYFLIGAVLILLHFTSGGCLAEEMSDQTASTLTPSETESTNQTESRFKDTIFDDRALIEGYTEHYAELSQEIILEMIKDETLSPYQTTAAIRVFNQKYAKDIIYREKILVEKTFLRKLSRTDSPYVQVEILAALCYLDRYRYFASMVPPLIQKISHYNETVNTAAFDNLNKIIETGNNRPREARIVFNTLRKVLFLSRKRLATVTEPGPKLSKQLKLLRWSIKVLGSEELQRLPPEVIGLL